MKKAILAVVALLSAGAASAETYAIQAGRLIVDASKPALGPSTLIVDNGRIVRIEPGATAPVGAKVVDMRGKTVLPGLIDVHVHLTFAAGQPWYEWLQSKYSSPYYATQGLKHAAEMARAGFTTVRDLGGPTLASLAVRDALRDGGFDGPRVLVSGESLSVIGGHGDAVVGLAPEIGDAMNRAQPQIGVCTGADECTRAVHKLAALGVDVIKFHATGGVLDPGARGLEQHFTQAEMNAIVRTSHQLHLKAAAHAHGARGIEAAARAGVDSIEHGTFIDEAGVRAMKGNGSYYSATLMAFTGVQAGLGKGIFTGNSEVKARQALAKWGDGLKLAYRGGVKIVLGTDSAVAPHSRAGEELGLMVTRGGMTPRDALVAATKSGAELLGLAAETGTLDPGKSADLIAVDGDPLTDPAAVTRITYVMVMGRPIGLN